MFTVEERDRVRRRLQEIARSDKRLVAGALVGSTAGEGDRWSDIDLTFAIAEHASVSEVLDDWTTRLQNEFGAMKLFDLPVISTIYRVFLFPGNLQVDLSLTPRAEFGALGPKFALFFGSAVKRDPPRPPPASHLFGFAVLCILRARVCIERGRLWEAEYLTSLARDQILTLACLRRGLNTSYGKGFDDLPQEILEPFKGALVGSLERAQLLEALRKTIDGLLSNAQGVENFGARLEEQMHELKSDTLV
jgi:hypothetical protein